MNENIYKYINFGIENSNGKIKKFTKSLTNKEIVYLITSKEFIEAIARGINKKNEIRRFKYGMIQIGENENTWIDIDFFIGDEEGLCECISSVLGICIYNNELPLFIKKILGKN